MDHLATASLLLKLTSIIFISSVSADPKNITAKLGQNVTLPCRAPDSNPVIAVEWDRTDLGSEYVLLYRNNHYDEENQHPSFKNRVDLQERQIKTGDVSLVVKNVLTDDRGTYECLIIQTETNRRETALYINLDVVPPPGEPDDKSKDGSGGWKVQLFVGLVVGLLLASIIFAIYFKRRKKSNSNRLREPAAEVELNPLEC